MPKGFRGRVGPLFLGRVVAPSATGRTSRLARPITAASPSTVATPAPLRHHRRSIHSTNVRPDSSRHRRRLPAERSLSPTTVSFMLSASPRSPFCRRPTLRLPLTCPGSNDSEEMQEIRRNRRPLPVLELRKAGRGVPFANFSMGGSDLGFAVRSRKACSTIRSSGLQSLPSSSSKPNSA